MAMGCGSALAQDCGKAGGTAAGTLANPQAPCITEGRRPLQPGSSRPAPDLRREPGVFRHGNTTVRIGGSVSTEATIRGR